jgi:hypothetical protein
VIGSLEVPKILTYKIKGWPANLYQAIDGDDETIGPSYNNNQTIAFFFIIFIFVGSFFFLNLFIGAICYHFDKSHKKEKLATYMFLTEE